MENKLLEELCDQKTSSYNCTSNHTMNFVLENELTVTVTLAEYRNLVSKTATSDAEIRATASEKATIKAEKEKLEKTITELKLELADLKAKLYEMQNSEKPLVTTLGDAYE